MKAGQRLLKSGLICSLGFTAVLGMSPFSQAAAEFKIPNDDLMSAAKQIEALADKITASTCMDQVMAMNEAVYNLKVVDKGGMAAGSRKFVSYFAKESGLTADEAAKGKDVLGVFFSARTKLHVKLQKMVAEGSFANRDELDKCTKAMKIAQRNLRGLEDYWGLMALQRAGKLNSQEQERIQSSSLQKSEWPAVLVNPAAVPSRTFTKADIKSGDLLMSLGSAFTASVIGRINSVDSQFSHLAMVYVDDGTLDGPAAKGKAWVIEAEPDVGVRIVPLDDYLTHGNIRVAVYRFNNIKKGSDATPAAEVAHRAGRYIIERRRAGPIPYNFAMDMKDESKIFCSQLIAVAFNAASKQSGVKCEEFPGYQQGKEPFPFVMSKFDRQGNGLVRMLEISVDETFAPGDVEMDPRLTLVAEWRNHAALQKPRYFNMTLSKVMQWLEQRNYDFADVADVKALSEVGKKAAVGSGKMPADMPKGFVEGTILMGFLMMHTGPGEALVSAIPDIGSEQVKQLVKFGVSQEVADKLGSRSKDVLTRLVTHVGFTTRLANLEEANLKATGYLLTDKQMDEALDVVMGRDCQKLQKGEPVMYHDVLSRKTNDVMKACDIAPTPLKGVW